MNQPLPRNLKSLTSCRLFAAIGIVIHHFANTMDGPLFAFFRDWGWLGVPFFFVLSGFVLMWTYNTTESKIHFYWRRLTRIYPLHLLCLLASLFFYFVFHHALGGYANGPRGIAANFLLIQNWVPLHPEIRQAWDGVAWSLSSEWFFYLLTPFLFASLCRSDGKRWLIGWCVLWFATLIAGFVVQFENIVQYNNIAHWLPDMIQYHPLFGLLEFMIGAITARLVRHYPLSWVVGVASFLPIAINFVLPAYAHTLVNLRLAPFFAFLIAVLAKREASPKHAILHHPLLLLLGESSFALYMIHVLMLGLIVKLCTVFLGPYLHAEWFFFVSVLLLLAITLTASVIIHLAFEMPVRRRLLTYFPRIPRLAPSL